MVTIEVQYQGELRCEATHGPSGSKLHTDAPADNMGRGESFSPTDLAATALATCAVTTMAICAQKEGIPFGRAGAVVEKHMIADPRRRIAALPLRVTYEGQALTTEQRARLEDVGANCPVALTLGIDLDIAFECVS